MGLASRAILLAIASLWLGSLALPAISIVWEGSVVPYHGFEVLFTGWLAIFALEPSWLANIFFWILLLTEAFARKQRNLRIFAAGGVAIPTVTSTFSWSVEGLLFGAYVWIVANLLLVSFTVIGWRRETLEERHYDIA